MTISRQEAEDLLYKEGRLLDQGQLEAWLEMFTDDACYWIPANRYDADPSVETSILYDNRQRMEERVHRLLHTSAYSQLPPSRTIHNISNVQVDLISNEEAIIYSNVVMYEVRSNAQRSFCGHCEHRIKFSGDRWSIFYKKVMLINNDLPIYNLTFMV